MDIQEKILKDLGCKEITTNRQRKNGTSCWQIPTGEIIAEYKTGMCRNLNSGRSCYQINRTKFSGEVYHYSWGTYKYRVRVTLPTRAERLSLLISYTIRKMANKHLILTSGSVHELIDPETNTFIVL